MKTADLKDKRLHDRLREVLSHLGAHPVASIPAACGGHAEERRFEHIDQLLPCVALFLTVAWRTLYVCRLSRNLPDVSGEAVFEPSVWKAVYRVVRGESPPGEPPPLSEMVRLVAQLGGYVNRPRKDPPGPQTVWIGLQRMRDFALCCDLFGPDAKPQRQLV